MLSGFWNFTGDRSALFVLVHDVLLLVGKVAELCQLTLKTRVDIAGGGRCREWLANLRIEVWMFAGQSVARNKARFYMNYAYFWRQKFRYLSRIG